MDNSANFSFIPFIASEEVFFFFFFFFRRFNISVAMSIKQSEMFGQK